MLQIYIFLLALVLTPIIIAIGNFLRETDTLFKGHTTLCRIIWFVLPFTVLSCLLLKIPALSLETALIAFAAWLCWCFKKGETANPYALFRGIILGAPFALMQMFPIAGCILIAFFAQGIINDPECPLEEKTKLQHEGEASLNGLLIGLALSIGTIIDFLN